MDSEDEAMPYLKLLSENSGNYLLQNSYELQDCLSVEPMFTEIEAGTWTSECFPVLLNDGNIKSTSDDIIAEKVQGCTEGKYSNYHIINREPVKSEDANICQKDNTHSSSDRIQNILLPQDSVFRINSINQSEENLEGKQKRTLLLLANGNTYELSYSNKSINPIELQELNEKSNLLENLNQNSSEINSKISHAGNPDDEEENISTSENPKDQDNDLSDWTEFYSIITVIKCKVCSFLGESSVEMTDHLKTIHSDLLQLKQVAEEEDMNTNQRVKMKSLLDSNSSSENNVTIFLCSMCNNIFSTKELLMEHVKIHNQEPDSSVVPNKSENANVNEITYALNKKPKHSTRNLATSLLRKHKFKCSVKGCTLKFSNYELTLRHEACHMPNMKQFHCPQCKEKFSIWRTCSKHLWKCHKRDTGLYKYSICNTYKSNSRVANHMEIDHAEKPFVCTECFKGFKELTQLKNHKQIHKSDEELPPWSTKRTCKICERFFANDRSLKKHIQSVHEKIKPFTCNICGHKTARKAMLELHIRQHTGDKPYNCPHCTYKTGDHNCLRKHVMKHYGFMKYACPYCKYQAIQSSAYKNHLVTKHPEENEIFKCTYCNFTSLRFESYLTHVKCHEYNEAKQKKELLTQHSAVNISINASGNQEKDDTQIYLYLPEDADDSEVIEDTRDATIPAM